MNTRTCEQYTHYDDAIQSLINHVGKKIVIGLPLGLGKPIGFINRLYQLACADNSIDLTIITALTLARPNITNELEKRLAAPILERIIQDYEDPLYEQDRVQQKLPDNIRVIEFFLNPAKYLHNSYVQRNYISSTYTHVIRDVLNLSINVMAQLVTHTDDSTDKYSVSCNSDLFIDLAKSLHRLAEKGKRIAVIGEVNTHLPYMYGDAEVDQSIFTHLIDTRDYKSLFALPRDEISPQDHLIGLYSSTLIKDNGCLQIGIGSLSNALACALIMRHESNALYQETLNKLDIHTKFGKLTTEPFSLNSFTQGLYASTEMLSDEYMHLYKHGILKKRVYDHIGLQTLLNAGELSVDIKPDILDCLLNHQLIQTKLTRDCVNFLKSYGIFNDNVNYENNALVVNSEHIPNDLSIPGVKQQIVKTCLGKQLRNGILIHAGFILGSQFLFDELKKMSDNERKLINMTSISRTNLLSWNPELLALQRIHGRFVNSTMIVTLTGAMISDGLENSQEVSGVGGQFDFVNMAQNLVDARSIITCRSTRRTPRGLESNIRWDYSNNTISRFLRDIVITEYGIADCCSKTDADVIKAILNITDSHFQDSLLRLAKKYGKIEPDYEIPVAFRQNYSHHIHTFTTEWQAKGFFLPFPFGTELTSDELIIKNALVKLKYLTKYQLIIFTVKSLFYFKSDSYFEHYLQRMQLSKTRTSTEWIYKKILKYALSRIIKK